MPYDDNKILDLALSTPHASTQDQNVDTNEMSAPSVAESKEMISCTPAVYGCMRNESTQTPIQPSLELKAPLYTEVCESCTSLHHNVLMLCRRLRWKVTIVWNPYLQHPMLRLCQSGTITQILTRSVRAASLSTIAF